MSFYHGNQRTPGLASRPLATILLLILSFVLLADTARAQGLGAWRVGVANLTEEAAKANLSQYPDLPSAGVYPYEGKFGIFGGNYATEAEANAAKESLTGQGILNLSVGFFASSSASTPAPALNARGGAQGRFRVLVGTYATAADAEDQRKRLLYRGFVNVDAVADGNVQKLYVGFESATRRAAESQGQSLRDQGFTYEAIVDLSSPAVPRAPVAPVTPTPHLDAIGRDFQARIRETMDAGNFDEASRLLADWERADPLNLLIPAQQDEISRRRAAPPAATTAAPTATTMAVPPATDVPRETFESLSAQATAAEQSGDLDGAKNLWRQAQNVPNITDTQNQQINDAISRISEREFQRTAPAPAAPAGGSWTILYAAIAGGLILLVVAVVIVLVMRKKSAPAPPPARPVAVPPAAPKPAPKPEAPRQAAPTLAATSPLDASQQPSTERFSVKDLEELQAASAAAKKPRQSPPPPVASPPVPRDSSVVMVAGLTDDDEASPATEVMDELLAPAPASSSSMADTVVAGTDSEAWKRIPLVREATTAADIPAHKPAAAPPPPAPPPPPAAAAGAVEVGSETQIDTSIPAQQRVQAGRVLIYKQNFDEEEVGKLPRGWTGEYDYASLAVASRDGKGNCMKFEKPTGSGSAFYSCKFPDAGGRVTVEFDLRCDNKNKYLLGFYIEKDADFRHSVHTVVHRDVVDVEKFYLRLQNETTAYSIGKWVHIRFHIDLTRSLVDGYIDDAPGAVGVRLTSRPRFVNTLSIRDNLATEGILLIDNIEIYQER